MLLSKEPHPVKKLPGARTGCLESLAELCVLKLEPFDSFGRDFGRASRPFNRFHSRFRLQRAATEARKLVAKMADELLKLLKCFDVRTIAVGFQVCSRVR